MSVVQGYFGRCSFTNLMDVNQIIQADPQLLLLMVEVCVFPCLMIRSLIVSVLLGQQQRFSHIRRKHCELHWCDINPRYFYFLLFSGNVSECALLKFGHDCGGDYNQFRSYYHPFAQVFPFSSDRKRMGTVISIDDNTYRLKNC
jgi:hypothetical protein